MDVKFKLEKPDTEEAGPQVFSFACGPPGKEVGGDDLEVELMAPANKSSRKRKTSRLLRVAPTSHEGAGATVVYTGQNYGSRANRFSGQQFAVSVFDPASGKATLVPVPHHFQMRQHLAGHKAARQEEEEANEDMSKISYEQRVARKRQLVESFGSRKKKRKMRSDAANEVDISAHASVDSVAASLRSASKPVDTAAEDERSLAAMRKVMLPPHDLSAQTAAEMYPLHGIVPENEWEALDVKPLVRMSRKPSLIPDEGADLPAFVQERIEWLGGPGGKDAESGKPRDVRPTARCLMHLTYLVRFYNLHMVGGKGRGDGPRAVKEDLSPIGCDEFVSDNLVRTFAARQGRGRHTLTPALQNKLRCYICVLALVASDHEIGYDAAMRLAKDMSMTNSAFVNYFREVGAKVHGRGKDRVIRLSAPLTLPKLRKRAGR